jgi:hypothetical protein
MEVGLTETKQHLRVLEIISSVATNYWKPWIAQKTTGPWAPILLTANGPDFCHYGEGIRATIEKRTPVWPSLRE